MSNQYLDRVQLVIKELEAIDPKYPFAYEKALLAFAKVKMLPLFINIVDKGLTIFRTRTHETDNLYTDIQEISNPNPSIVKSFARCNRPYQSIFYASENRPTSYLELVNTWAKTSKNGDRIYVTIGEWELVEDLRGVLILNPDKSQRSTEFEKYHGRALDYFLDQQEAGVKEASIVFLKYISRKFNEMAYGNPQTYILTSAFSNWALHHIDGQAESIIYPSVPYNGKGINYAIRPEFVKNIQLRSVIRNTFDVQDSANGKFNFNEIEIVESTKIDQTTMKIEY